MRAAVSATSVMLLLALVADPAPGGIVRMARRGRLGQTILYQGRVDFGDAGGWIESVTLVDLNRQRGSGGVLSGFDCDFVIFDMDGNIRTRNDWTAPLAQRTRLRPGRADYPSRFQPTRRHPGPLFGLSRRRRIRHRIATLGRRDARYRNGRVSVDSCFGFLSLGDGGHLMAGFERFWVGPGESVLLVVGDAGVPDESLGFAVSVASFAPVVVPGGSYAMDDWALGGDDGEQGVFLDGSESFGDSVIKSWHWDLNNDGIPDLSGPQPFLSHGQANALGLDDGQTYEIKLTVETYRGTSGSATTSLTVVPEPVTLSLLGLGFAALAGARRRRRRS